MALSNGILPLVKHVSVHLDVLLPANLLAWINNILVSSHRILKVFLVAWVVIDIAVLHENLYAVFSHKVPGQILIKLLPVVQNLVNAGWISVVLSILSVSQQYVNYVLPWFRVFYVVVVDLYVTGILELEGLKEVVNLLN